MKTVGRIFVLAGVKTSVVVVVHAHWMEEEQPPIVVMAPAMAVMAVLAVLVRTVPVVRQIVETVPHVVMECA